MTRWGAVIVLVASLCGTARAQEHYVDAESEMAQAAQYFQQQNYRAALAHYAAARMLAPDKPGPLLYLGLTHAAMGQCVEAIPHLEQYLKMKTQDAKPEALRTLAECKAKTTAQPGRIHVGSEPAGAEVRIDDPSGPPAGTTPFESAGITAGTHRIHLSKPGFSPANAEVKVLDGMIANVQLTMQPTAPPIGVVAPPPPAPRKKKPYWIAGVVVGAVAAVGLAVGLGVGLSQESFTVLERVGASR